MFNYQKILVTILFFVSLFNSNISADGFQYNSYNNHGVIGLINLPSARFYSEASFGVTLYDGTPDQKITMTSSPYDWMEASFFYTNIQDKPYGAGFNQDYKDKGFNVKIRLKQEGIFPAVALGINDIAGTGLYSSEYIVASYGINNVDMHFGLGWGALNGSDYSFKNPFTLISNKFNTRPDYIEDKGGDFTPSRYFSDKEVSPFFGINYSINNFTSLKIEYDTTLTPGQVGYEVSENRISYGLDFAINKNFNIGVSSERDNYFSVKFSYKSNGKSTNKPYKYKTYEKNKEDNSYDYLIKNLESNGIGVNKIIEGSESIGLELTQFSHPNLDIVEDIIKSAVYDSGIKKSIKTDYRVADLQAYSNFDEGLSKDSKVIYERKQENNFNTSTRFNLRPYIAAREDFLKLGFLIENNSEYIIKDNLFFSSNLKYSIDDNFDDLTVPPVDTYPAQVRSDVKEYLRNFNHKIIIGRAQFDYHLTPKKDNHIMLTAGILEEMFSGYGLEYLYFQNGKDYAVGFEVFKVKKRDYRMKFGTLDYENTTGSVNFYYRNYNFIPFDAKISYGEYLAGDTGSSFELSRSFRSGAEFGIFATFTDVTATQFGEGSFDKGIFFTIPIYKNLVNYTWRPLTKDPGARLNRKHTLYDLLVKFKPHNN